MLTMCNFECVQAASSGLLAETPEHPGRDPFLYPDAPAAVG